MKKILIAAVAVPVLVLGFLVVVLGGSSSSQAQGIAGPCNVAPAVAGQGGRLTVGTVELDAGQVAIATTVVGVVKGKHLPARAAVIALATAWVESTLHNYDKASDHDSLGVFQQRPSQGWGSAAQVTDVVYATNSFLSRMVNVAHWQTAEPGSVAQAVQRSAYPDRYRVNGLPIAQPLAAALFGGTEAVGGVNCTDASGNDLTAVQGVTGVAKTVLARAHAELGLPYCWAGGTAGGPSHGTGGLGCGGQTVGFDCSGLALYAWAGVGVSLSHYSPTQYPVGRLIPIAQARPGDLVYLSSNATVAGIHHTAIVWSINANSTTGSGRIIEAQDFGVPVHIRSWAGSAEPEVMPYVSRPAG